jgi:hypothetical protein
MGLAILCVAADDRGDDAEQLGGHGYDALPVTLRWGDHEQSDDLAVGPLVLPDAEMGELKRLSIRCGEDFHDRSLEERGSQPAPTGCPIGVCS